MSPDPGSVSDTKAQSILGENQLEAGSHRCRIRRATISCSHLRACPQTTATVPPCQTVPPLPPSRCSTALKEGSRSTLPRTLVSRHSSPEEIPSLTPSPGHDAHHPLPSPSAYPHPSVQAHELQPTASTTRCTLSFRLKSPSPVPCCQGRQLELLPPAVRRTRAVARAPHTTIHRIHARMVDGIRTSKRDAVECTHCTRVVFEY